MRLAIVTDIHGNLPALEAVWHEIAQAKPDFVIDLGDIASGPLWPRETVQWLMAREAAQSGHARYLGPVRKFMLCLCPALFAGGVLTVVLWRANLQGLLPGTWLLLYGCAVVSASTVTIASTMRLLCTMGALFVALGLFAFVLPAASHMAILGLGFGVLHVVFGYLVGRSDHAA